MRWEASSGRKLDSEPFNFSIADNKRKGEEEKLYVFIEIILRKRYIW